MEAMEGDCKNFLFETLQIIFQGYRAKIEILKNAGQGTFYLDTLFFDNGEITDIKIQDSNINKLKEKLRDLYSKRDKIRELEELFGETDSSFDQGIQDLKYQLEVSITDYLFKELCGENNFKVYNNSFSLESNLHLSLQNIIFGLAVKKYESDKKDNNI